MEVSGEHHVTAAMPPGNSIGGWVGSKAIMDVMEKRIIFAFAGN
jgi:hypothetical protein